jgi:hypothetical protein
MNIATALLQSIKERGLDNLFQVEESAGKQPKLTILNTLKGQTDEPGQVAHPTPEDQLRLVIIYYLSMVDHSLSKDDLAELTALLQENGADTAALEYVKKTREVSRMTMMASQPAVAAAPVVQGGGEWTKGFSALGSRVSVFISCGACQADQNRLQIVYEKVVFRVLDWTTLSLASRTSCQPAKSYQSRVWSKRSWSHLQLLPKRCRTRTTISPLIPNQPVDVQRHKLAKADNNTKKPSSL